MANIRNITDVCIDIFAGGDAPKGEISDIRTEEYPYPIFSNGEINDGLYGFTNHARVDKPSITISARGTIGYASIRTEPFLPIVRLITLIPNESIIDIRYLYYAVQNYHFSGSGTSILQLTVPMLKKYSFPVPSHEEQRAVVECMDTIADVLSLRERQLAKLGELVKSRFVEMFGTIRANHFNYPIKTMAEVSSEIFAGGDKPQNCVAMPDAEHPYPVYANGYENAGLQGYSKSCRVTRDAVTVSARGTIGYCFIRKGNFTPIVRLITVVPDGDIIVEYLKEAIDLMEIKSSGTSQAQLTVPDFKKERLIIPPLELQNRFAAFVAEVDKSKLSVQQSITQLETLKKSLMQKYFG